MGRSDTIDAEPPAQRLDRGFAARWAALTALLCWPLLWLGQPAYFYDTVGYYRHGYVAVSLVTAKLVGRVEAAPPAPSAAPASPPAAAAATPAAAPASATADGAIDPNRQVRGARSLIYSVMTYLLAGPRAAMIPLAVVQALAAAFVAVLLFGRLRVASPGRFAAGALAVAFLTPAAWYACFALPDVFAATGIAGIALLLTSARSLSPVLRVGLLLLTALSLALHASHLLVGVVMLIGAALLMARGRLRSPQHRRSMLVAAAALMAAIAVVATTGYVAFGEFSIAPKRYPLTLARVIEDGPARRYLAEQCPRRHYEICRVMPDPPPTAADIVFGPSGLKNIATPAQLDRIREQEVPILLGTLAAYPGETLGAMSRHSLKQLFFFGLSDLNVAERFEVEAPGVLRFVPGDAANEARRDSFVRVTDAVSWLTLALLPFAFWLAPGNRRLIALITLAVVANALICASLSAVADRYQGRLVWLLSVVVFAIMLRRLAALRRGAAAEADGSPQAGAAIRASPSSSRGIANRRM